MKLDALSTNQISYENSTFYDIQLGNNITLNKFKRNVPEISFRLGVDFPPYLEILPREGIIRLQVVNNLPDDIDFVEHYYQTNLQEDDFFLGRDYFGKKTIVSLSDNSNILLSGTTGSGKSMALHTLIANCLLKRDSNIELFLGDPKLVEFSMYKDLNNVNYLANSYSEHLSMLDVIESIMNQRFQILKEMGQHNIDRTLFTRIIVIIDEISDLVIQDKQHKDIFQTKLVAIAQKCRAAGINLIIATQRPSVDILPGAIKANFPVRIACKVSSKVDSKVILDEYGAENLLGRGDAIINSTEHKMTRFKFASTSPKETLNHVF